MFKIKMEKALSGYDVILMQRFFHDVICEFNNSTSSSNEKNVVVKVSELTSE